MVTAKSIGAMVKMLRKARGLSQTNLADSIGRSHDAISQIERGISIPNVETLHKLGIALQVPLDAFFHDVAGSRSSEGRQRVLQAVGIIETMTDRELAIAITQLQALKKGG